MNKTFFTPTLWGHYWFNIDLYLSLSFLIGILASIIWALYKSKQSGGMFETRSGDIEYNPTSVFVVVFIKNLILTTLIWCVLGLLLYSGEKQPNFTILDIYQTKITPYKTVVDSHQNQSTNKYGVEVSESTAILPTTIVSLTAKSNKAKCAKYNELKLYVLTVGDEGITFVTDFETHKDRKDLLNSIRDQYDSGNYYYVSRKTLGEDLYQKIKSVTPVNQYKLKTGN